MTIRTLRQTIKRESTRITCPCCGYIDYIGGDLMNFVRIEREDDDNRYDMQCSQCGNLWDYDKGYIGIITLNDTEAIVWCNDEYDVIYDSTDQSYAVYNNEGFYHGTFDSVSKALKSIENN